MQVIYVKDEVPTSWSKSIFLAGPTSRTADIASWRPEALKILQDLGYDGVVFVPETRNGEWHNEYIMQVEWEEKYLNKSDCIVFWVPRDMKSLHGLTTNIEWGVWADSGKAVFGAPLDAERVSYMKYYANKHKVLVADTLKGTLKNALDLVTRYSSNSSLRIDGETDIPLHIWSNAAFRNWYQDLKDAGNRLESAKVLWKFSPPSKPNWSFAWLLHANIFVTAENRIKDSEFVFARSSIDSIVMFNRSLPFEEMEVVIVKEFRSPCSNKEGMVSEFPGGSSFGGDLGKKMIAKEVEEETGLTIDVSRIFELSNRQLAATLSTHKSNLFGYELNDNELATLKSCKGIPHGVKEDGEITYVEVKKVSELVKENYYGYT